MSRPLDEFFAEVEAEFGVSIDDQRDLFDTPGAVIDYLEKPITEEMIKKIADAYF